MRWINEHPDLGSLPHQAALSIQDIDGIIHQYKVKDRRTGRDLHRNHIMLIETKKFHAPVPPAQWDTYNILHQALWRAHKAGGLRAFRGKTRLFYHGVHLLSLSGASPEDSEVMLWDKKPITIRQLLQLCRFELNATTLKPREDRSHHQDRQLLLLPGILQAI
jgi:hypothetical protein